MSTIEPFELPEDALPPAEVRFSDVHIEPWPDGKRIRVHLTLTPFIQRPNLYAEVQDFDGNQVCSAHIIETMESRMVFTLHLRGEPANRKFTLTIEVFYEDIGAVDSRAVAFEIHDPSTE